MQHTSWSWSVLHCSICAWACTGSAQQVFACHARAFPVPQSEASPALADSLLLVFIVYHLVDGLLFCFDGFVSIQYGYAHSSSHSSIGR